MAQRWPPPPDYDSWLMEGWEEHEPPEDWEPDERDLEDPPINESLYP